MSHVITKEGIVNSCLEKGGSLTKNGCPPKVALINS